MSEKAKVSLNQTQVVTGEVRLSYVFLFEPTKFDVNDPKEDAKYMVTILIPKDTAEGKKTIADIEAAIKAAAEKGMQKHFGGRMPTTIQHTLKDGDTAVDDMGDLRNIKQPELAGHMYMRLSTKFAPKVLNAQRQEIINPLDVYSGMYGRVSLTAFAYSGDGRRGVSAVLNNVMITRDGEPLTSQLSGDEF